MTREEREAIKQIAITLNIVSRRCWEQVGTQEGDRISRLMLEVCKVFDKPIAKRPKKRGGK